MVSQAETLTLTALVVHLRLRLLDALQQPPTEENKAALTGLWRTCLTIHDLAEERGNHAYVALMERMIDAVADYSVFHQPENVNWGEQLPSVEEIEAATAG
jgi:hypothetical protein